MASIAMVLLRFLRERYEASALFAGREPPKIVAVPDGPGEAAGDAPPEKREAPSQP